MALVSGNGEMLKLIYVCFSAAKIIFYSFWPLQVDCND